MSLGTEMSLPAGELQEQGWILDGEGHEELSCPLQLLPCQGASGERLGLVLDLSWGKWELGVGHGTHQPFNISV